MKQFELMNLYLFDHIRKFKKYCDNNSNHDISSHNNFDMKF